MRVTALVLVALVASMSGSLAVTSQPQHVDISKMTEELISQLDNEGEIEAIIQFHDRPTEGVWRAIRSMGIEVISANGSPRRTCSGRLDRDFQTFRVIRRKTHGGKLAD